MSDILADLSDAKTRALVLGPFSLRSSSWPKASGSVLSADRRARAHLILTARGETKWLHLMRRATAADRADARMSHKYSRTDLARMATGLFLVLVGLAYFGLLLLVLVTQSPDTSRRTLGVLSFFIAMGVLLVWIGVRFLRK